MANEINLETLTPEQIKAAVVIAQQVAHINKNPEAKNLLGQAWQRATTTATPDLETRVTAALAEKDKEIKSLEMKVLENEVAQRRADHHTRLKEKYKLDAKGIEAVEKVIVDKKIGDYDAAAEFYLATNKPAAPTTADVMDATTFRLPDVKKWFSGNPTKVAREEAAAAFDEIRKARASGNVFAPLVPE